jgi:hypothetical protein
LRNVLRMHPDLLYRLCHQLLQQHWLLLVTTLANHEQAGYLRVRAIVTDDREPGGQVRCRREPGQIGGHPQEWRRRKGDWRSLLGLYI